MVVGTGHRSRNLRIRLQVFLCLVTFSVANVVTTDAASAAPGDVHGGWAELAPQTSPPARSGHSMAYDEKRRQTVVFGGSTQNTWEWVGTNDLWVWDGEAWAQRVPVGETPRARAGASFVYDPARDEFVLFGGVSGEFWECNELNDTWVLKQRAEDGVWAWTKRGEVPFPRADLSWPTPRTGASMAYDSGRGQMVLFGGDDCDWTPAGTSGETWLWNGTGWTKHHGVAGPTARSDAGFARDYASGRLVLFGGWEVWGFKKRDMAETWSWGADGWRQENPGAEPPARSNAGLAYSARDQRMVLFGGTGTTTETGVALADTWLWDGADWTLEIAPGPTPRAAALAPDPAGTVLLFGGAAGGEQASLPPSAETWEWNGPPSVEAATVFVTLDPPTVDVDAGSPTPSRTTATVVVRRCLGECASPDDGIGLAGQRVRLSTTGDAVLGPVTDHRDGTYSADITASRTPGTETITASAISGTASAVLAELAGPPAALTLGLSPQIIPSDGIATSDAAIHVSDVHGNPVSGHGVRLVTSGDVTVSGVTDEGQGDYAAAITASHTNGRETLTASTTNGVTATATLTEYGAPVAMSLVLEPPELPANGTSTSKASVTITDDEGIAVPDAVESVVVTSTGDVAISAVANGGDGTYRATVTASRTPGTELISARSTRSRLSASAALLEAERALVSVTDVSEDERDEFVSDFEFTVRLSPANDRDLTFRYVTSDGTALAGQDYVPTAGTLTFPAGETSRTVSVRGAGDTDEEASETFSLLVSAQGRAVLGDHEGVGTVVDDDTPPVLKINDVFLQEGNTGAKDAIFNVTLDPPSGTRTSTVRFTTVDGTAGAGSDYTTTEGTLEFGPDDTFEAVRVPVRGDLDEEPDETFTVRLSDPTRADIADNSGMATLVNDDGVSGLLGERVQGGVVLSGHDPDQHAIGCPPPDCPGDLDGGEPSNPEGAQHIIQRTIAYVTGEMALPRILSVSHREKGERGLVTSGYLAVDRANHKPLEDEFDLRTVDFADYDAVVVASTSFIDQEDVDILNARHDDVVAYVNEGGGLVAWEQSENRAPFGFIPGLKSAPWNFQQNEEGIRVTPAGEAMGLTDEDVNGNVAHQFFSGTCGFDVIDIDAGSRPVTLASHEPLTACGLRIRDVTVDEGDSGQTNATLNVTIDDANDVPVRARYTTVAGSAGAGTDYAETSGTVVFEPGETLRKVVVPILGDAVPEPDESFTVRLSEPQNALMARGEATVEIVDGDRPSIEIADATATEGATAATATVSLSQPPVLPVEADVSTEPGSALAAGDFTTTSRRLRFEPGETTQSVAVPIADDSVAEATETFGIRLSGVVNAVVDDGESVVTIVDDDIASVRVDDSAAVKEGDAGSADAEFGVRLSVPSSEPVRVEYSTAEGTASPGVDYRARSGVLAFSPGQVHKVVSVPILDDDEAEPTETFTVSLETSPDIPVSKAVATATIVDDDPAKELPAPTTSTTLPAPTTTTTTTFPAPPPTTTPPPRSSPEPEVETLAQVVPPLLIVFTPPPPLEPLPQPLPQPNAQPVTQSATQPNPQPQTQSNPQPQAQSQVQQQAQQQAQAQSQAQSQAQAQAQVQPGLMVDRQREVQVEKAAAGSTEAKPQPFLATDRRASVPAATLAWWTVLAALGMAVMVARRSAGDEVPARVAARAAPSRHYARPLSRRRR